MAKKIVGPDGRVYELPDDATDEEISGLFEAPRAGSPGFLQGKRHWSPLVDIVKGLPMAGTTLGGLVGGLATSPAGPAAAGGAVGGAMLGAAAGKALEQLGLRMLGQSAPSGPLEAASAIAKEAALQGALQAMPIAIFGPLGRAAKGVYRGYLKPSLSERMLPKAEQIVETGIREHLPVTAGGRQQARRIIRDLHAQVRSAVAESPERVDLHQIAESVREWAKAHYYKPGQATAAYEAALGVADDIERHPSLGVTLPPNMPIKALRVPAARAQEVKEGLYRAVKSTGYGDVPELAAARQTRKIAAHELKTAIEAKVPDVIQLNARESRLIETARALSRAAAREENKSRLTGVYTILGGMAGGGAFAASGNPAAAMALGLAVRTGLSAPVATRAAIVASRLAGTSGMLPVTAARVAVEAVRREEAGETLPQRR